MMAKNEDGEAPERVYAWPAVALLCGECGCSLSVYFLAMEWNGEKWVKADPPVAPRYYCKNQNCPRSGKAYTLSTAHAYVLEEVASATLQPEGASEKV